MVSSHHEFDLIQFAYFPTWHLGPACAQQTTPEMKKVNIKIDILLWDIVTLGEVHVTLENTFTDRCNK